MANPCSSFLICTLLILTAMASSPSISAVDANGDHHKYLGWAPIGSDPLASDEEFEMESEISRRILATTKYISYGALQRNTVPCSRRGASYYNCQPGAQANPYNRGCSAITKCRS